MVSVNRVTAVHDLHVWTITSGIESLSAHVLVSEETSGNDASQLLEDLNLLLKKEFGIDHTTIQIEHSGRQQKEPRH